MTKQPKFHIYEDDEGYTSKAGAKRAVDMVIATVMAIVEFGGVLQ